MGRIFESGQAGGSARPGRSSQGGPANGPTPNLGWIPVALGAAAIVAGLGGRRRGAAALALTALAGAGAVGAARGVQLASGKQADGPEVERSITIGKPADALRADWLDPRTLPQIMAGFASVRASGGGRMHWKVEGPPGHAHEWETETVDAGEGIGWRSLSGAPIRNEAQLRFRPAPAGRGTVVTLRFRFEPPAGAPGEGLLAFLGAKPLSLVADGVLRRFKNLVEAGEIPTTRRQPAARANSH